MDTDDSPQLRAVSATAAANALGDFVPAGAVMDCGTVVMSDNTTWSPEDLDGPLPEYDGSHTLGILRIGDNAYPVKNGKGEPGAMASRDKGIKAGAVSPTHAEGHAIMIMRLMQAESAVLNINNPNGPCGFCDKVIENMLAPGATLTINWPGGSQTFTGNDK